ncbi:hypothetical protein Zmor_006082 [Zophobas morio]|uniref:Uncharacterized protein n=1 Tax=Zophobas morio TaxID=2755281 RepID=A0AA38IR56_9CUCU|nr:hypothetical protein Zmor_006082 [Zophobas morio]
MPSLNIVQKQTIAQRLRDGVSIRAMATELHISKNTVPLAKKKLMNKVELSEERGLVVQKKTTADENTTKTFNWQISFQNILSKQWLTQGSKPIELRNRAAANKIFLTEQKKANRVLFAQEFVNDPADMWNSVILSDEKTFKSYSNGRRRVYRPPGTRNDERYCNKYKQSGRFSVNVWGWVSSRDRGICAIVEERLNANVYRRQWRLVTV